MRGLKVAPKPLAVLRKPTYFSRSSLSAYRSSKTVSAQMLTAKDDPLKTPPTIVNASKLFYCSQHRPNPTSIKDSALTMFEYNTDSSSPTLRIYRLISGNISIVHTPGVINTTPYNTPLSPALCIYIGATIGSKKNAIIIQNVPTQKDKTALFPISTYFAVSCYFCGSIQLNNQRVK